MAGRPRMPSRDGGMRGSSGAPGILGPFAAQQHSAMAGPPPPDFQRKLNGPTVLEHHTTQTQHEIRLLLSENQHLAATHVALRQELLAAQQEGQRMHALLAGMQSEKDGQVRALLENSAKLEAELRATESLRVELQQARFESKRYTTLMHELNQQLMTVSLDLQRFRTEAQQIPPLKAELDNLRQDLQRTRTALEYEESMNGQYLEQKQLAEKDLVAMAREVESLRAELASLEGRARFNPFGYDGVASPVDYGYVRQQQLSSENYAAAYAVQRSSQWSYNAARQNGLSQGRR